MSDESSDDDDDFPKDKEAPSEVNLGESSVQQKGETETEKGKEKEMEKGTESEKVKETGDATEEGTTEEDKEPELPMVEFKYMFKDKVVKTPEVSTQNPPEIVCLDTPPHSPKEPERSIPISAEEQTSSTSQVPKPTEVAHVDVLMAETHDDLNPIQPEQNPEPSTHHHEKPSLETFYGYLYSDRDIIQINSVPMNPYLNPIRAQQLTDARRAFIQSKSNLNPSINSNFETGRILDIRHKNFQHNRITFHEYTVESKEGKIEIFNDNDLVLLNPYDLLTLHAYCVNFSDKYKAARTALPEIRLAMEEHVNLRSQADFQLGIIFEVEKLGIAPPNEDLANLNHYKSGKVVGEPPVLICRQKGQKKAIRAVEVHKYSNESLRYIRNILQGLPRSKCPEEQQRSFIFHINSMLNFRELICKFDKMLRGDIHGTS